MWFWVMGSSLTLIVAQKIRVFSGQNIGNILVSWAIFLKSHPLALTDILVIFIDFFQYFFPFLYRPLPKHEISSIFSKIFIHGQIRLLILFFLQQDFFLQVLPTTLT